MSGNFKDRFSEGFSKFSERFNDGFSKLGGGPGEGDGSESQESKKGGASSTKKSFSDHLSTATSRMKDMFRTPTVAERLVEEATAAGQTGPDWAKSLAICDLINAQKATGAEVTQAVKRRLGDRDYRVQGLALVLLETLCKNCEGLFSDVAAANVLDDVVAFGRDNSNPNSTKALILIEAWGEAKEELRYLPIFAETYTSLQAQGVRFPGRDAESLAPIFTPVQSAPITTPQRAQGAALEAAPALSAEELGPRSKEVFEVARNSRDLLDTVLTSAPKEETLKDELTQTLVSQVQRSQRDVQALIQAAEDNEAVLFEALNVNDDLQKSLTKYEELAGSGTGTGTDRAAPAAPAPSSVTGPPPNRPPSSASQEDNPQAQVYADLLGEEEDGDETALVRKNKGTRPTQAGDDQALADLDEMIFGKKEGASEAKSGEGKKDLISF